MIEDKWIEEERKENQLVYKVLNEYLIEDDGSDLIPNHVKVRNMLERITSERRVFTDEAGRKNEVI